MRTAGATRATPATVATVAVVAALLALAGCTVVPAPSPTVTPTAKPTSPPPRENTAAELFGTWTIVDSADGMPGRITFGLGHWDAHYECGDLSGEFAADDGVLLVTLSGWSMACADGIDPQPSHAWTDNSVGARRDGDGWTFIDANGALTAELTEFAPVDGSPPPNPAPLPPDLVPGDVVGRWLPIAPGGTMAFLEFADDGTWEGSDGCNGLGGRWADLGEGRILSTPPGFMTLVGCDNVDIAHWMAELTTAGFADDLLVLVDGSGAELVRFRPAP